MTNTSSNYSASSHTEKAGHIEKGLRLMGLNGAHTDNYQCADGSDSTVWMDQAETYGISILTPEDGNSQVVSTVSTDHEKLPGDNKNFDLSEVVSDFIEWRSTDLAYEFLHGETRWTLAEKGWQGGNATDFARFCMTDGGAADLLPQQPHGDEISTARVNLISRLAAALESALEDAYDPERHNATDE